tara:strand:+ start:652 stop:1023 length:372 start_codon:yes stop_codon:yes gene_type:complete
MAKSMEQRVAKMAADIERLQNYYAKQGRLHNSSIERLSRKNDPQTSKDSAKQIMSATGRLRETFLQRLKQMPNGATANEIARGDESVRKRAAELQRLGLIEVTGKRRCSISNKVCQIYKLAKR